MSDTIYNSINDIFTNEAESFYYSYLQYMNPRWLGSSDNFEYCVSALYDETCGKYSWDDIANVVDNNKELKDKMWEILDRFYDERDFEIDEYCEN